MALVPTVSISSRLQNWSSHGPLPRFARIYGWGDALVAIPSQGLSLGCSALLCRWSWQSRSVHEVNSSSLLGHETQSLVTESNSGCRVRVTFWKPSQVISNRCSPSHRSHRSCKAFRHGPSENTFLARSKKCVSHHTSLRLFDLDWRNSANSSHADTH